MEAHHRHSNFLLPGIICLGAVLRIPITSIPPILTTVAKGLNVNVTSLGILTTLPLLAFAFFSPLAPKLAHKLGNEGAFVAVLLLMIVGSILRVFSVPLMFAGTLLLGIGISQMNVLLPTIITANFPHKIGLYTAMYTFTMGLMTAVASMLAVPITNATSWQTLIILLTVMIGLALLVWLPNLKFNQHLTPHRHPHQVASSRRISVWQNKKAWLLLIFMGIQSAIFYTSIAWLPTIASDAGLSPSLAGILAGINALVSLPVSFLVPNFVTRFTKHKRQLFVLLATSSALISFTMLLFPTANFSYWLLLNIFNGLATGSLFPYLMTSFSNKTRNATETAELSGMVQAGGYLLAAIGPVLFGNAYAHFHSWTPQIVVMLFAIMIMGWAGYLVEKTDKIFN